MARRVTVSRPLVPSRSVVDSDVERRQLWRRLMAAWGVLEGRAGRGGFVPNCNPVSLSRLNARQVMPSDALISSKSDGVHYSLYLFLRPDSSGCALMTDRARAMFEVECLAPHSFFERETLLEGELVWRKGGDEMLFLVFDCIRLKGELLTALPFRERLARITAHVGASEAIGSDDDDLESRCLETESICITHFEPRITLRPKVFVERRYAAKLWSDAMREADHLIDGLIIADAAAPYESGTSKAVLKWKHVSSVDLRGAPPALCALDDALPERIKDRTVEVLPSRIEAASDEVVEYSVHVTDTAVQLMALRRRSDKTTPNALWVVLATIVDEIEKITVHELATLEASG